MAKGRHRREQSPHPVPYAATTIVAIAIVGSVASISDEDRVKLGYEAIYTASGRCLDDSPFDPEQGAHLSVDRQAGSTILTVTANDQQPGGPDSLHLLVRAAFKDFRFADHRTAGVLVAANCPGADGGS